MKKLYTNLLAIFCIAYSSNNQHMSDIVPPIVTTQPTRYDFLNEKVQNATTQEEKDWYNGLIDNEFGQSITNYDPKTHPYYKPNTGFNVTSEIVGYRQENNPISCLQTPLCQAEEEYEKELSKKRQEIIEKVHQRRKENSEKKDASPNLVKLLHHHQQRLLQMQQEKNYLNNRIIFSDHLYLQTISHATQTPEWEKQCSYRMHNRPRKAMVIFATLPDSKNNTTVDMREIIQNRKKQLESEEAATEKLIADYENKIAKQSTMNNQAQSFTPASYQQNLSLRGALLSANQNFMNRNTSKNNKNKSMSSTDAAFNFSLEDL